MKSKKFSAIIQAQPVIAAMDQAIRNITVEQAIAVLEEIADHASAKADALREEMGAEEAE